MTKFNPAALTSAVRSLSASTDLQIHNDSAGFTLALDGLNGSHPQAEFVAHENPYEGFRISNSKYVLEFAVMPGNGFVPAPVDVVRPILNRVTLPGVVPSWVWRAFIGVRVWRHGLDACWTVGDCSAPDPAPESRCPALPEGLWDLDLPNLEVAE